MTDCTQYQHILFVEEEKDLQFFPERAFQTIPQIRLSRVEDPRYAISIARLTLPRLVIAEVFYPNYGGYLGEDFFDQLRNVAPDVKFIVTSTLGHEEIAEEFLTKIKVQCYLKKPYDLEFLVKRSCELLNMPVE